MKKVVISILIIFLVSCNQQKTSNEEEKQIFESLLISVLDSIHFSVLPPPNNDSIKRIYENDKMLIILKDSTEILTAEDQLEFLKYYKNISVDIDSFYKTKIDRNLIKFKNLNSHKLELKLSDDKYTFKLSSQQEIKSLNDKSKFFCGELGLSNIKLDNSKTYGLFSVSYNCCEKIKCGSGYSVFIKKVKNIWKVDKIITTWNS